MGLLELFLLSVSLAMDCFSVSLASGVILKQPDYRTFFKMAFFFGLFQALMPCLGWAFGYNLQSLIESFDHWLAFGLLALLGVKMIIEGFKPEEHKSFNPRLMKVILALSVATSIDALAVGMTFAFIDMPLIELALAAGIIGVGSFLLSLAGSYLGIKIGNKLPVPPEAVGGAVLIGIGTKILLEHLGYL